MSEELHQPSTQLSTQPLDLPRIVAAVPVALRSEFFSARSADELERYAGDLARGAVPGREAFAWADGGASLSPSSVLPEVEVLVTAWGMPALDEGLLDAMPRLRLVAHTGATVRPFVTPELFERGVLVTQAGLGMARSVAEVALTFTLSLLHQVHRFDRALRSGMVWHEAEVVPPRHEVLGSVIGVVGASRTGRAYIEVVRALGAEVLVYDPFLGAAEAEVLGVRVVGLDELMRSSRIVAVHAPSLPQTHHMVGARELALMQDGSGLVNTARSWLVDEEALVAEVSSGRLDAALDVFDDEPLPQDHPLRALPNVLLTPHHAAGTVECRLRQGRIVVEEIGRLVRGEPLVHGVGVEELSRMA